MKKYMLKMESADRLFGGEVDTAYVERCMAEGMPEEDVKHLIREWGTEVLEMFDIIED